MELDEQVQAPSWEEAHPWLSERTVREEGDSIDEVIRYTLDEIRFA